MARYLGALLAIVLLVGCQRQIVTLTIRYDRQSSNDYPYTTYDDVATIYYTLGAKNYEQSVRNHGSIEIKVPEKTLLRATIGKSISDASGVHQMPEDIILTVDRNHPEWIL